MDKTLLKGLRLLDVLARSGEPRGVSGLAREIGLAKSNVHRTLQTLAEAGFVRKHASSGNYECTLKLFELGSAILSRTDVRRAAETPMEILAGLTQETIHLSVLDGGEVVYLHKIESPQPVRAYSSVGGRAPAHCVASGKALLAFTPGGVDRLPDPLPAFSPSSISRMDALQVELAEIRRQGFAVNRGEWRSAVRGIAAPVFDASGANIGAIGISGPAERFTPESVERFSGHVIAAARDISKALGHRAGPQMLQAS